MVTVIGGGSWGTALAQLIARNGHPVRLWVRDAARAAAMRRTRTNPGFHDGVELHPDLSPESDFDAALAGARTVVLAVPSYASRAIFERLAPRVAPDAVLVSTAKGIERETGLTLSRIATEYFSEEKVARDFTVLSGPSFAYDVVREIPTAVTLAGRERARLRGLEPLFHAKSFHVFFSDDVTGVELAGALKNVVAIAAGALDGLGFGQSTRATLIARGIREISRIGEKMGARADTFSGLAGLGDLILTCTGDRSRNRRIGLALAQGKTIKQAIAEVGQVAEGIRTAKSAWELSSKLGAATPIIEEIYRALYEGKPLAASVESILNRSAEAE